MAKENGVAAETTEYIYVYSCITLLFIFLREV